MVPAAPPAQPAAAPVRAPVPDMPEIDEYDDAPPWADEGGVATSAPALAVAARTPPAAATPPRVVAIPVRDPGPASERVEQRRSDLSGGPDPSRLVPTPEGDFWAETVTQLVKAEAITALVRELGLQSQLVSRSPGQWLLRIERESLAQGSTRERLAAALAAIGHAVKLATETGPVTDSPALRQAAEAQRRHREAESRILDDPFVQTMMRDFGGKIVPGTLKADPA